MRQPRSLPLAFVLLSLAAVPLVTAANGSRPPLRVTRTVWDSVYSADQAARGETAYVKTCARCHGTALSGGDQSPPLAGSAFLGNWNGTPLSDLQTRILTTMPSDSVGIYKRDVVTDVMAYLLKGNGFPAGPADLPSDAERLKDVLIRDAR